MPELPEVETIRRGLQKVVAERKIEKFESFDSKVVQFAEKDIEGLYVTNIERRAKILIFHLSRAVIPAQAGIQKEILKQVQDDNKEKSSDKILLCHLKMTGQLIWEACPGGSEFCLKKSRVAGGHPSPDWVGKLPNAYTRAIFHFNDESVLFFNDLRRFGYMKLYDTNISPPLTPPCKGGEYAGIPELAKLGPEPFSSEFNVDYLMRRASKIPNRKVKQFITDQEIISGVGNIYVDEALFYAGVLPTRPVRDITKTEWQKIIQSITKALELGLKYGGSSEDTYVDAFGNQGSMNEHTMVYRKTGQPCQVCGTKVERITLGGRGTHFCPKCQK